MVSNLRNIKIPSFIETEARRKIEPCRCTCPIITARQPRRAQKRGYIAGEIHFPNCLIVVIGDENVEILIYGDAARIVEPGIGSLAVLSAAVMHRSVDAAILVFNRSLTAARALTRAREVLEAGGIPLLGLAETFAL